MPICPHCGAPINIVGDLNIKTITSAKEISMISCRSCQKVLGFAEADE